MPSQVTTATFHFGGGNCLGPLSDWNQCARPDTCLTNSCPSMKGARPKNSRLRSSDPERECVSAVASDLGEMAHLHATVALLMFVPYVAIDQLKRVRKRGAPRFMVVSQQSPVFASVPCARRGCLVQKIKVGIGALSAYM
jgi:hypothetical protein